MIKTSCNELFGQNLTDDNLPSGQTCINICDEGNTLAKKHFVERIRKALSLTFHRDGTGRDQKKLLGNQMAAAQSWL